MPRAYITFLPAIVTLLTFFITSILLQVRFNRYHVCALVVGLSSLGLVLWGDQVLSLNYFTNTQNKLASGMFYTLLSCFFKASSFLVLEAILRNFPILELLSFYGIFGLVISFLFM